MAFDKCTLLSSQGSDAPAAQPHSLAHRATSLSYPTPSPCQISVSTESTHSHRSVERPRDRTNPPGRTSSDVIFSGGLFPLEGNGASASPFLPLGRTSKTLRGFRGPAKSAPHPGRVARDSADRSPVHRREHDHHADSAGRRCIRRSAVQLRTGALSALPDPRRGGYLGARTAPPVNEESPRQAGAFFCWWT